MTAVADVSPPGGTVARQMPPSLLLLVLAGAVAVRVGLAGASGARSLPAGLVFAAVLAAAATRARMRARCDRRAVAVGLVTTAVLVVPVLLHARGLSGRDVGGYPTWAAATTVVAVAEEALLRGALFDAVAARRGVDAAVVVAAVAFAAIHVPLYGWSAMPLDLAVGVALGAARVAAGSWAAPAIAHVGADLLGWWWV